jgi:hypothetical protein
MEEVLREALSSGSSKAAQLIAAWLITPPMLHSDADNGSSWDARRFDMEVLGGLLAECISNSASRAALVEQEGFSDGLACFLYLHLLGPWDADLNLLSALFTCTDTLTMLVHGESAEHNAIFRRLEDQPNWHIIVSALLNSGADQSTVLQGVTRLLPALASSMDGGLRQAQTWRPIVEAVMSDAEGRQLLVSDQRIRGTIVLGVLEGCKSYLAVFEAILRDDDAAVELLRDEDYALQLLPTLISGAEGGKEAYYLGLRVVAQDEELWDQLAADEQHDVGVALYSGLEECFAGDDYSDLVSLLAERGAVLGNENIVEDMIAGVQRGEAGWLNGLAILIEQADIEAVAEAGILAVLPAAITEAAPCNYGAYWTCGCSAKGERWPGVSSAGRWFY